jgi:hypothetical protein
MPPRPKKKNEHSFTISRGSAAVRGARHTVTGANGRAYHTWRLRYHLDGKPHRPTFPEEADARKEAERVATIIANGRTIADHLSPADTASFARAKQILAQNKIPDPIEIVIANYCQFQSSLAPLAVKPSIDEIIEFYLRHHPPGLQKTYTQVKDLFIAEKERDGTLSRQRLDLKSRLKLFDDIFKCPLVSITRSQIADELDRLQKKRNWVNRTRNHHRAALSNLFNWARENNHAPEDWNPLPKKFRESDGPIITFTPEEIAAILHKTPQDMLPAMIICCFAQVRTSEVIGRRADRIPPLDWSEIDLKTGEVLIIAGKIRTAGERIANLPKNAIAWLRPLQKKHGPIWRDTERNFYIRRCAICKSAKVEWKDNAARRTAISRRAGETKDIGLVSSESGSSVATLNRRYRKAMKTIDVAKFRAILPKPRQNKIIPLKQPSERQKHAKKNSETPGKNTLKTATKAL